MRYNLIAKGSINEWALFFIIFKMVPVFITRLCLAFLLINFFIFDAYGKLLMTVCVVRHGAREPNHPYNEILEPFGKKFGGLRALTNIGERQQYILGEEFSQVYNTKSDISPAALVVRATDRDRTFMSGMSFLDGITQETQLSTHQ